MASPALLLLLFLSSSTSPLPTERPTGAEEAHHAPSHPDHILASFFKTFSEPAAKSDPKPEPQLLEPLGYNEGVEGEVARAQDRSDTTKAIERDEQKYGLWLAITSFIAYLEGEGVKEEFFCLFVDTKVMKVREPGPACRCWCATP